MKCEVPCDVNQCPSLITVFLSYLGKRAQNQLSTLYQLQVMVSAPTDTNLALWRELGAQTTHDNADVVLGCDVIFLAVKPHIFPEVRNDVGFGLWLSS